MSRSLWTLAALALMPAISEAKPPDPNSADVLQTLRACKRLQEDDVLGPLNIGVKVRGRVAVLWGPVPTADLALRAERQLRTMFELIDVRNELIVMPEDLRDLPLPFAPPPFFLPEKAPPPMPEAPRRFLQREVQPESGASRFAFSATSAAPRSLR